MAAPRGGAALSLGAYGVPYAFNPHFLINTLTLMRGAVGLQRRPSPDSFARRVDAVLDAMWAQPRNLGDATELAAVLTTAGIDGDVFAVADEMFFGQDRRGLREAAAEAQ